MGSYTEKFNGKATPETIAMSLFLREIQAESDRGAALFAAAFFDEQLKIILMDRFKDKISYKSLFETPNSALHSLSSKISLCHALEIISDHEFGELNLIRKIRNDFAHKFELQFSFSDKNVKKLCLQLKSHLPGKLSDFEDKPRIIFNNAVIMLYSALTFRLEWLKHLNAQ